MKLKIYNIDGTDSGGKAELSDSIFKIEPNETVLYEDVRSYLASQRQGTASTKERSEVRGGGRKAYRQKGTGMARRGSIRSPLLKGGGTVFGPKPRKYSVKLSKKARRLARKSALSLKASEKGIKVLENFTFDEPKTKQIVDILNAFDLTDKKVLILTESTDVNVYKSARNIPWVQVLEANKPASYQIMNADFILIQKDAIAVLENSVDPKAEEKVA
ncbi:MAG: 50S ribosomal protein L4 [Balneolaceae bacterium]